MSKQLSKPRNIGEQVALLWLALNSIKVTDVGEENVYFVNTFGNEFYCKCYLYDTSYYNQFKGVTL